MFRDRAWKERDLVFVSNTLVEEVFKLQEHMPDPKTFSYTKILGWHTKSFLSPVCKYVPSKVRFKGWKCLPIKGRFNYVKTKNIIFKNMQKFFTFFKKLQDIRTKSI